MDCLTLLNDIYGRITLAWSQLCLQQQNADGEVWSAGRKFSIFVHYFVGSIKCVLWLVRLYMSSSHPSSSSSRSWKVCFLAGLFLSLLDYNVDAITFHAYVLNGWRWCWVYPQFRPHLIPPVLAQSGYFSYHFVYSRISVQLRSLVQILNIIKHVSSVEHFINQVVHHFSRFVFPWQLIALAWHKRSRYSEQSAYLHLSWHLRLCSKTQLHGRVWKIHQRQKMIPSRWQVIVVHDFTPTVKWMKIPSICENHLSLAIFPSL